MVRNMAAKIQNHEKLRKLQDELRSLIAQADQLRAQIDIINATIQDLAASIEVLEYIKKYGEGKTVLVPIGAGNFIRAKIEKPETVIMGVGGRLSVEVGIDDARKMIEERIATLEELRLDLLRKLEEVNRKINEILPQVEELARQEQQK
jgi:prefoldin alpha subunit